MQSACNIFYFRRALLRGVEKQSAASAENGDEKAMESTKIVFPETDAGSLRWITITTLLLAISVILRMASPSIGGISLNWNIVMYCLAILLCRPTPRQGLGIGFVSGLVAMVTSKAALPYANLISDPLAAFVCAYLAGRQSLRFHVGGISVEPALLVFLTTCISGGTFVTLTKIFLNLPMHLYLYAMLPTVCLVALFGMAAGQALYAPARRIFSAGDVAGGAGRYFLKEVRLTVPRGGFCVLTGANGSGKTSLLLAIAGARAKRLAGFEDSEVVIGGVDVLRAEQEVLRAAVGMVMADYEGQLVTETVGDEIAFSLENLGRAPQEIVARRREVLAMVGLEGMEERTVASLSGGQKQRLAIAAMLAADAQILVLDEPVAAIDPEGAIEIYQLLKVLHMRYGKTIIVAEHDLKYVEGLASQLAVLEAGTLRYTGDFTAGLRFMYRQNVYAQAVPLRWKIYLELEAASC